MKQAAFTNHRGERVSSQYRPAKFEPTQKGPNDKVITSLHRVFELDTQKRATDRISNRDARTARIAVWCLVGAGLVAVVGMVS